MEQVMALHPHEPLDATDATPFRYDQAPMLVYWEVTRACDLACIHCRAEAAPDPGPDEMTFAEGRRLLQMVRDFGPRSPHLVITGGDPMRRPDLPDLVAYARSIGVPVALAPSATPLLTAAAITKFGQLGVDAISLSLDGPTADLHDGVRGVPGTFERTLTALAAATASGMQVQINTLVTVATLPHLPTIYHLLQRYPITRWSLFFLIQTGRGTLLQPITADECEALFLGLTQQMETSPFEIKATEAPHFRRVAVQYLLARGVAMPDIRRRPVGRGFGVRDGNGVVFVAHDGEVYPSGFLPLSAGNVRTRRLTDIYRQSDLLVGLRDSARFQGKCGRCSYRSLCGGSRARAFGATGDPLASDPLCAYEPPA